MSTRRRFSAAPATVSRPPDDSSSSIDILAVATREINEDEGPSGPGERPPCPEMGQVVPKLTRTQVKSYPYYNCP